MENISKTSSNMGVYRMTPRPQMFMPSMLRPAMNFLDTPNDFSGVALSGMHNKEVFQSSENLKFDDNLI